MRRIFRLKLQGGDKFGLVFGLQVAQSEIRFSPQLVLGKSLSPRIDRTQTGDQWNRDAERIGCVPQQVARQNVEAVQRPAGDAHEHDHQRGRQTVRAAELLSYCVDVGGQQLEELLAIEIAKAGWQAFLTDETQGERGHGRPHCESESECIRRRPDWLLPAV